MTFCHLLVGGQSVLHCFTTVERNTLNLLHCYCLNLPSGSHEDKKKLGVLYCSIKHIIVFFFITARFSF